MAQTSEALLALKPVTFCYKKEIDPAAVSQFGLVAEEVEKVNPDLVVRDKEGKPYSVRYDQVNAMLLNEFLKEHRKNEEQEATITHLESAVAQQKSDASKQESTIGELKKGLEIVVARLKAQDSKIQKVSDQLELSKPALQTVVDNQ
jgi:trimeric autotransporter adhesin